MGGRSCETDIASSQPFTKLVCRGTVREDVELFFDEHLERDIGAGFIEKSEAVDVDHGRIETRCYTVCSNTEWLAERHNWPGLKAVVMVEYTREIRGKTKTIRQFYISSVLENPEKVAHYISNHWQVENCLHWVLDVTFRQDDCRIRTGNAAANFATINHAAMNLLRRAPGEISLPQKRRSAAWDDTYMEAAIRQ